MALHTDFNNVDLYIHDGANHLEAIVGDVKFIAGWMRREYHDYGLSRHLLSHPTWQKKKLTYITHMRVVTPGQGLGSKMLKRAIAFSKKQKHAAIFLHALADVENGVSLQPELERFYIKHGFRKATHESGLLDPVLPIFWRKLNA